MKIFSLLNKNGRFSFFWSESYKEWRLYIKRIEIQFAKEWNLTPKDWNFTPKKSEENLPFLFKSEKFALFFQNWLNLLRQYIIIMQLMSFVCHVIALTLHIIDDACMYVQLYVHMYICYSAVNCVMSLRNHCKTTCPAVIDVAISNYRLINYLHWTYTIQRKRQGDSKLDREREGGGGEPVELVFSESLIKSI